MRAFGRQRRHGAGLLEPDIGVELLRQHCLEIMAGALGLGIEEGAELHGCIVRIRQLHRGVLDDPGDPAVWSGFGCSSTVIVALPAEVG